MRYCWREVLELRIMFRLQYPVSDMQWRNKDRLLVMLRWTSTTSQHLLRLNLFDLQWYKQHELPLM
jgi:hypothetical protein